MMYQTVSIMSNNVLHGKEPKVWRAHKLVPRWQRNTKVVSRGEFSIFYTCSLRPVHIHSYILFIFISIMLVDLEDYRVVDEYKFEKPQPMFY